tara:strand:- start:839 stop:2539 length:1701 start_codon:yes stop_codon:yes gene_type:complete
MAKTLKEMRVATPQTRGMAGSRGIMRKKTGPRGANKKEKVYEPTRGQLNNIRRRGEGISSTTKFMDQVRSIAPSVYNHPKVQDIFRNHAETNEDVKAIKYDSKGSSMDYFLGADPRKTKEYKALKKKSPKINVLKKGDPRIKAIKAVQDRKKKRFDDLARKETQETNEDIMGKIKSMLPGNRKTSSALSALANHHMTNFNNNKDKLGSSPGDYDHHHDAARHAQLASMYHKKGNDGKRDQHIKSFLSIHNNNDSGSHAGGSTVSNHVNHLSKVVGTNMVRTEDVEKAGRVARSYMMKKPNPVNITRAGINKAGRDALKKATTSYDKHNKDDVLAKHGFKRPTSEAVNPHDDEGANHIVMQLRKAVTLRGMRPVEFKDGKKVRVEVGHAQKFLSKYNQAKPADKEKMQAKAQKSHGHFKSTISEEFELNEDPSKSLKDKSEKSRIPVSILRSVYNRGMAAWKGGHRKGMAQQQWAHARVNSFISKGSGTWGKADKDLADKARAAMKSKKNESVNEDRMAGKYRKGQTIVRGQWPNPDKWAEEYIMPNADKKGVRIYSTGPAFVIEKL